MFRAAQGVKNVARRVLSAGVGVSGATSAPIRTAMVNTIRAGGVGMQKIAAFSTEAEAGTAIRPEPQCATTLTQIGTRRIFDFEHDQYRELCRRFYEEHVIPFHDKWEEAGQVPRELWLKAGEQGLLCVTVPEQYGGMGLDVLYVLPACLPALSCPVLPCPVLSSCLASPCILFHRCARAV
jgi:hypothetical protein